MIGVEISPALLCFAHAFYHHLKHLIMQMHFQNPFCTFQVRSLTIQPKSLLASPFWPNRWIRTRGITQNVQFRLYFSQEFEFGEQIELAGEMEHVLEAIKWGADYFSKADTRPNVNYMLHA
ncbi:unnamed protein product [Coffea canephora]|uniref:DH200=94 genomic scaffold, scaffold_1064 n=1 Tax=Coffea canephora TaxID=49390 RepID=A0A068VI84_COFCA|nr:unnamed protein product [Coffea canephora]